MVEDCIDRLRAGRHVEEDGGGRRASGAPPSARVDEDADLLVARTREPESKRGVADVPTDLGNRAVTVVEALDRREQTWRDPRRSVRHPKSVRHASSRARSESEPFLAL